MRNASSLPRLDDVIETIEDLQSNPSSRRTTYRYFHIMNLENNNIADVHQKNFKHIMNFIG